MKKIKYIVFLVLAVLVILPFGVKAADLSYLRVDYTSVSIEDGATAETGWSFDGDHTLTLNNYNGELISAIGDLIINLVGTNTITTTVSAGISCTGNLTINSVSDGKLIINSQDYNNIIIHGSLIIDNANIEFKIGNENGISIVGNDTDKLIIKDSVLKMYSHSIDNTNGDIEIESSNLDFDIAIDANAIAISTNKKMTISGDSVITVDITEDEGYIDENIISGLQGNELIIADDATIDVHILGGRLGGYGLTANTLSIINNADVTLTVDGTKYNSFFLYGIYSDVTVSDNANLDITLLGGTTPYISFVIYNPKQAGINAENLTIEDNATVTVDTTSTTNENIHAGLLATTDMNIFGGTTKITVNNGKGLVSGLYSNGTLDIKDANVEIKTMNVTNATNEIGIYLEFGLEDLTIDNSHVKIMTNEIAAMATNSKIKLIDCEIVSPKVTNTGIQEFSSIKNYINSSGTTFVKDASTTSVSGLELTKILKSVTIGQPNPDTGDNIITYVIVCGLALAFLSVAYFALKKAGKVNK